MNRTHIFRYKFLYTGIILLIYIIGRDIPLFYIDLEYYQNQAITEGNILMQSISGDLSQTSIFALGIAPFMSGMILAQLYSAIRNNLSTVQMSPKKIANLQIFLTLIIAIVMSFLRLESMQFLPASDADLLLIQTVVAMQMITGALIISWISTRNKKYGIGGQTVIILVNILDGLTQTIVSSTWTDLLVPAIISAFYLVGIIIIENSEYRIPLQRVSIHNIHADKDYMAFKLNPTGMMPIMFASAVYLLPQGLVRLLAWMFPSNSTIQWWVANLTLTTQFGYGIYLILLVLLSVVFAYIFIDPAKLSDNLLKGGDSIQGLHAGKQTKRYLMKVVFRLSFTSGILMAVTIGIPRYLSQVGVLSTATSRVSTSVMILTGLWCNVFQEVRSIRSYDSYEPFI